jgi:hypothetical protein
VNKATSLVLLSLAIPLGSCGKPAPAATSVVEPASPTVQPPAALPTAEAASPTAAVAPPKLVVPADPACPPGGKLDVVPGVKRCVRNGLPDGPEVRWHEETGHTLAEVHWKAGKKDGPAKFWSPDGQLRMETAYRDDLEEGLHRHYANGKVVWEGENHAGKAEGKWTYYRATDGTFDRMECQQDGKAVWNLKDQREAEAKKCPP